MWSNTPMILTESHCEIVFTQKSPESTWLSLWWKGKTGSLLFVNHSFNRTLEDFCEFRSSIHPTRSSIPRSALPYWQSEKDANRIEFSMSQ
jgi:hypothetical protein